uniref:ATP-dependent RNA helicase n=1 Tax=Eptatretus burgeri TaxID=7764 RepID=A0A8C4R6D1_EPTBU
MKGKKKKVNEAVRVAEKAAADTAEVEELASGFGRLQKHGVHIKGRWKSLPITADLLDIDNMSGFVCMEELTDYSVVSQMFLKAEESGNGDLSLRKSAKKRKYEQSLDRQPIESEKIEEQNEKMSEARSLSNIEGGVKKKKRKRNKRKQKALPAKESGNQRADGSWTAKALVVAKKGSEEQMERSSWEGLCVPEPVLQALLELGFSQPTAIQALALPAAIRDMRDVLGAAETGSGKTLAYGIPVIQRILEWQEARLTKNSESQKEPNDELEIRDSGEDGVELRKNVVSGFEDEPKMPDDETVVHGTSTPLLALVVAPTRELAVQVKHHLDAVAKHTGIRTAVVVGGMAVPKQQRVLNQHPEVVVGTPGRLWQLINEGHPHLSTFTQLRCLVLDEADRLLEPGHFAELTQLIEFLDASKARGLGHSQHSRQTFVFSATLTLGHATPSRHFVKPKNAPIGKGVPCDGKSKLGELIKRLGIRPSPKIVDLTRKGATAEALTETRLHCDTDEKDLYLYYFIIQYPGRTMVFANSVSCVKRLVGLLSVLGCDVVALHANMHQKQRLKNLERFASRDRSVAPCTLSSETLLHGLDHMIYGSEIFDDLMPFGFLTALFMTFIILLSYLPCARKSKSGVKQLVHFVCLSVCLSVHTCQFMIEEQLHFRLIYFLNTNRNTNL